MRIALHINRKTLIMVVVVTVILAAGIIVCLPEPELEVQGNLSPRDVSSICRVVRAEIRESNPIFDDLSWDDMPFIPGKIRQRLAEQVVSISSCADGTVKVDTGGERFVARQYTYWLKKNDTGWDIVNNAGTGWGIGRWEWPSLREIFLSRKS